MFPRCIYHFVFGVFDMIKRREMLFASFPLKGSKLIIPHSIRVGFSSLLLINFPSRQTGRLTLSPIYISRSNISEIFNNSVDWKVNVYNLFFFSGILICVVFDLQFWGQPNFFRKARTKLRKHQILCLHFFIAVSFI